MTKVGEDEEDNSCDTCGAGSSKTTLTGNAHATSIISRPKPTTQPVYSEVSTSTKPTVPRHEYHSTEKPARIPHQKGEHQKNLLLPSMGLFCASSGWCFVTPPESGITPFWPLERFCASSCWCFVTPPESGITPFWPLESHGRTQTSSLSLRSLSPFWWGFHLLRNTSANSATSSAQRFPTP